MERIHSVSVNVVCPVCEGDGVIAIEDGEVLVERPCRACDGTGRLVTEIEFAAFVAAIRTALADALVTAQGGDR